MSSAVSRPPLPTGGPSASGDEFDDLNDYDIELDDPTDPFGNNYQVPQDKNASSKNNSEREKGKSGDGLGLDEEVEVTRKARAPRVKLDEHRLLSAAGIPRLRKKAREHLKFKGKGHEVIYFPPSNPRLSAHFHFTNAKIVLRRLSPPRILPVMARRSIPQSPLPRRPSNGRENGP
jgi:hypothetical protein